MTDRIFRSGDDSHFRLLRQLADIEKANEAAALRSLKAQSEFDIGDASESLAWMLANSPLSLQDLAQIRSFYEQRYTAVYEQLELEKMVQLPDKEGWVTGSKTTGMVENYERELSMILAEVETIDAKIQEKIEASSRATDPEIGND